MRRHCGLSPIGSLSREPALSLLGRALCIVGLTHRLAAAAWCGNGGPASLWWDSLRVNNASTAGLRGGSLCLENAARASRHACCFSSAEGAGPQVAACLGAAALAPRAGASPPAGLQLRAELCLAAFAHCLIAAALG